MASIINGSDDWLNAESHMSFLPFFGDNCAVNRRLARLMGVPLVGCANNRLNLAVRRFLKPYEKELEQWARSKPITTRLRPKLRQDTQWGSTYTMPARYFELREYISTDDEELAEEMSSPAANSKLKTLLVQLADAPYVAMKLQCED
ncbi:hypothetical protein F443_22873 [Phytophthora nicotianae P1569]|uniref:Uncharacterized protein n=2 Tax=Phytophthora nicotianae TaxID=4792 RepID=V9DUL3_PHYNI|nr:hypothetical protein F443_22873 [Phytophthora nicotianae P1569]